MTVRVGINGFGRVGRCFFRIAQERGREGRGGRRQRPTDTATLAHLLEHDSTFGRLAADVRAEHGAIVVDGQRVTVLAERDPALIDWNALGVDVVIESTGKFRTRDTAAVHLKAGARKVIVSAPGKDELDATFVLGVNEATTTRTCTTSCRTPRARPTAWRRWARSSTTRSASSAAS